MLLSRIKLILILCSPAVIWGILFIVAKQVLNEISPLYLAILRYGPATILIVIILYFIEGKKSFKINKEFLIVAGIGAGAMFGFNVLVWIGVGMSNGIIASIFQPLMPLIGVLITFIFFKQKYNVLTFIIILIAFFGVLLASSKGDLSFLTSSDSLGVLFIFVGVFVSTFAGILSQRFKSFSMLRYTTVTNGAGLILFCLLAILGYVTDSVPVPSFDNLEHIKWEMLYIVIFTGPLPLFLWYKGFAIIGTVNGMLLNNLVPLVTITGSILLGYHVGSFEVIGSLVIISAMFLHYFNVKRTTHVLD